MVQGVDSFEKKIGGRTVVAADHDATVGSVASRGKVKMTEAKVKSEALVLMLEGGAHYALCL